MRVTFEAYRRLVLKELTKTITYRNFHVIVKAYESLDAMDNLARALYPLLRACWQLKKPIEFAAKRIDYLTEAQRMATVLYNEEVQKEKREDRKRA